ncbi:DUF58 domain-containing protein [Planococcus liqunii]|uniref:DUF58 domain-containing protein n=1 Tax=Planococcus liqunii TaxID=3058394 RepID=UPI00262E32AF|nr:DUF58 domain-containing protein [Planococcus sp. N056]WKA49908.1 DUF58 domain-containing protein [Planococcus sp. N056]
MVWIRHDYNSTNTKWLLSLLAVFFFLAMAFLQFTAAAVAAFIAAVAGLQWLYFVHVGKRLELVNSRSRKRLLAGGESAWELVFENKGLPVLGGQLKIWFQDAVLPQGPLIVNYGDLVELDVPFTIGHNETLAVNIPVTGNRRGLARLKKMELSVPHPFGEGSVVLEYKPMILQELLVYPKLQKAFFHYSPSRQKPGQFNLKHSLFDDAFQPIGTRDYVPTDSFNTIHWKASARMQSYQTKVFDQVANESILFALNVADHYATIPHLEERIEEVASYIETCYREGIPYALAVNIRSTGKMPFLYLAPGEGPYQRQKALEMLSVMSKNHSTMPYPSMLAHLDAHIELPFTTYLMADEFAGIQRFVSKWATHTELKLLPGRKGSGIR